MAVQTATATFDGTQDTITLAWPTPFDVAPTIGGAGIGVTDGSVLDVSITNVTPTGCDATPTGRFNGAVEVTAIS
jgi:hypothetical protein